MSVYFAQLPTGGIKIGHSEDVPTRMAQLEAHYGVPLALLHVEPGGRPEEASWHERFATARLGRTEQFRPVPELLAAIGRPLLVSENPEAIEAVEPAGKFNILSVRGTEQWRDWLMRLAKHRRLNATDVIDQALVEYADRHGFGEAPPER